MFTKILTVTVFCLYIRHITGHGMMLDPLNRSSLWRSYNKVPINYNDNQNFCGGRSIQWDIFDGKCGVCGDRYDDEHPQQNENTGKYGRGVVVTRYNAGEKIDVSIELTSNHLGYFEYSLCVLEDVSSPEQEECFHGLLLGDGTSKYNVTASEMDIVNTVILPEGVTCERCVLRWTYTAGNSWGFCEDGNGALGCGPQETFRNCADISIV